PAVREYLKANKLNKTAFFCTYGGSEGKTFKDMEAVAKKPIAVLGLKDKVLDRSKIKKFCEVIV
ncbi:MAG: hypothetical protein KJ922_03965, partial [Nanoarchaeota archaeon]|nr:hypothetical protein [Nanoarchaeota archaeon]